MKKEQIREFTIRISQANPISMITILYEITEVYIQDAEEALKNNEKTAFVHNLHLAQDCISELLGSLNRDYDPAPALQELYLYMHRQMAAAILTKDTSSLEQCKSILKKLISAYQSLEKTGDWEPVMENVQQVYTGYTYGRNSLPQSMTEQSGSRGYLV